MNLYTYNQDNGKKYTSASAKLNGRTKEEFAKEFIKAYDGALKMAMGKSKKKNNFKQELEELIKLAEEIKKDAD